MELNREPAALIQGLIVPVLMGLALLFNLTTDVQAIVDAFLLAFGGVAAAVSISVNAALPLLAGFAKAFFALLIGLGLDVPPNWQATVMTVVAVSVAYFTRTQVIPKAPAVYHTP